MTADVELPLPRYPVVGAGDEDSYNTGWNECLSECRACVAHATAAQTAKIEALRAERDLFRDETITLVRQNGEWQARAARMAEALQIAFRHLDIGSLRVSHKKDLAAIVAALHPTAAQENDDA